MGGSLLWLGGEFGQGVKRSEKMRLCNVWSERPVMSNSRLWELDMRNAGFTGVCGGYVQMSKRFALRIHAYVRAHACAMVFCFLYVIDYLMDIWTMVILSNVYAGLRCPMGCGHD